MSDGAQRALNWWAARVNGPGLAMRVPWSAKRFVIGPAAAATAVLAMFLSGVALGALGPERRAAFAGTVTAPAPVPAPVTTTPIAPAPVVPPAIAAAPTVPKPAASPARAPARAPTPAPTVTNETPATPTEEEPDEPPVKHVVLVTLTGHSADEAFGASSPATWLRGLLSRGTFLRNHHAVARGHLSNGIALLSGQGPTPEQIADCPAFADVAPAQISPDGQELGAGCRLSVQTAALPTQLIQAEKPVRTFVEGLAAPCPAAPAAGAPDPFGGRLPIPFLSALSERSECKDEVVAADGLVKAFADAAKAPAFSYVVPGACHDGRDAPCAPAAPAGLPAADVWLRKQIAPLLATAAFKASGLLVVTFDEGAPGDTAGCCAPKSFPNAPDTPPGGGRVGAVLVGPAVKAGKVANTPSNHYALLRLIEDALGLDPLGYASDPASAGLAKRHISGG